MIDINLNIKQYNSEGQRHGYWEIYYRDGKLKYRGNYINGKRDGYWESHHDNSRLYFKGNFVNGKKHGYWEEGWFSDEFKFYYL